MLTLSALEAVVVALGKQLSAPAYLLPSFGRSHDAGQPEVRVDAAGYHLVVMERGQELRHQVFAQLEELLFAVCSTLTFSLASRYELDHRTASQDSRIVLFDKQVALLAQLDASWAARCRAEADWYRAGQPGPRPI